MLNKKILYLLIITNLFFPTYALKTNFKILNIKINSEEKQVTSFRVYTTYPYLFINKFYAEINDKGEILINYNKIFNEDWLKISHMHTKKYTWADFIDIPLSIELVKNNSSQLAMLEIKEGESLNSNKATHNIEIPIIVSQISTHNYTLDIKRVKYDTPHKKLFLELQNNSPYVIKNNIDYTLFSNSDLKKIIATGNISKNTYTDSFSKFKTEISVSLIKGQYTLQLFFHSKDIYQPVEKRLKSLHFELK